jgi:hypothetical protein
LLGQGLGLTGDGQVEHLLGEDLTDLKEKILDLGQGGPPGGAVGAIELIDEVFGNAFDVRTDFIYLRTPLFLACHLPFLAQVVSKAGTSSPKPV